MTNNISVYVHIPFCVRKCDYCAFYSLPSQGEEIKQEYYEALLRQIDFFDTDKTVSSIYFGGGTPPLIGIERLCVILTKLRKKLDLSENCEITAEVNPETVSLEDLFALKKAGFNRLSVGIQAADDKILASIGRIHSFASAKRCIENAKNAGFPNISADIIFALPNQSFEQFKQGVIDIMSTGVQHISAYSLQLEEGTPLFERRNTLSFPEEESEEAQYNALCEILKSNGFRHYEISSFAKEGYESRHNMNYWARGEYFGFGAAAHSFFEGKRFSAKPDIADYIKKSPISLFAPTDFEESEFIGKEEAEEERIMLVLRTSRGVSLPERSHKAAETIAKLGYGDFENGILRLNSKGFRVSNSIIAKII